MDSCVFTLLFVLLMPGGCLARVVTVSPTSLFLKEGQPLSIGCEVNDYEGPSEQDFEWVMSREANGRNIHIISTFDPGYPDSSFRKRITSGDISLVRLQDNKVELRIAEVKLLDAGYYLCQTPSTDSVIRGNYEAVGQLTVIPNTLRSSLQTPSPVVQEGTDIMLSTNVTQDHTQPVYLTPDLGSASEELLSVGPDRSVAPNLTQHVVNTTVRRGLLDLMSRVTTSDEAMMGWTHENGGSTEEMETVTITPTERESEINGGTSSEVNWIILIIRGGLVLLLIFFFIYVRARARQ